MNPRSSWLKAVLLYGVGDVATTWIAFATTAGTHGEQNALVLSLHSRLYDVLWMVDVAFPVSRWWVALALSLVVLKVVALLALLAADLLFRRAGDLVEWWPAAEHVVPSVTALVGLLLVANNLLHLAPGPTVAVLLASLAALLAFAVLKRVDVGDRTDVATPVDEGGQI